MPRQTVTLNKQQSKGRWYWCLRWFASNGKRRGKTVGRADQLSKRQAEKLRRAKEVELGINPARRDVLRGPELHAFLNVYFAARKGELAEGTVELHRRTGNLMKACFGRSIRLDTITRSEARRFKAALANAELSWTGKQRGVPKPATVDQHIRNARTIFNHALADDLILFNPFDRLAETPKVERDWHYVDLQEFAKLFEAAPSPSWRLLLALARLAALRRGEALNLPWGKIDWSSSRLQVISREGWDVKDKHSRIVPVSPELHAMLLTMFEGAAEGETRVIPVRSINLRNLWRDFGVICKRAGVLRYAKPIHSLRKSCIRDWADRHPAHVVKEWAGHTDLNTTDTYYLQVPESEYERAAKMRSDPVVTQLVTQLGENGAESDEKKKREESQVSDPQGLNEKAGERIRTADVQLGNPIVRAQVLCFQGLTTRFLAGNEVYN